MSNTKDDDRGRKLQAIFDQMPDSVSLVYGRTEGDPPEDDYESRPKKVVAVFAFSMKGYGFGELTFVTDESGQTYLDTERTDPERVKQMLGWLVDHAITDYETNPVRHLRYNEVRGAQCGRACPVCNPKPKPICLACGHLAEHHDPTGGCVENIDAPNALHRVPCPCPGLRKQEE